MMNRDATVHMDQVCLCQFNDHLRTKRIVHLRP
jgi:hypothetical protein